LLFAFYFYSSYIFSFERGSAFWWVGVKEKKQQTHRKNLRIGGLRTKDGLGATETKALLREERRRLIRTMVFDRPRNEVMQSELQNARERTQRKERK